MTHKNYLQQVQIHVLSGSVGVIVFIYLITTTILIRPCLWVQLNSTESHAKFCPYFPIFEHNHILFLPWNTVPACHVCLLVVWAELSRSGVVCWFAHGCQNSVACMHLCVPSRLVGMGRPLGFPLYAAGHGIWCILVAFVQYKYKLFSDSCGMVWPVQLGSLLTMRDKSMSL